VVVAKVIMVHLKQVVAEVVQVDSENTNLLLHLTQLVHSMVILEEQQ
jgi:hypothetical protein